MKRKGLHLFEPLIASQIEGITHIVPGLRASIALGTDPDFTLGGERRKMLIRVFYALFHFSNTLKNTDCLRPVGRCVFLCVFLPLLFCPCSAVGGNNFEGKKQFTGTRLADAEASFFWKYDCQR